MWTLSGNDVTLSSQLPCDSCPTRINATVLTWMQLLWILFIYHLKHRRRRVSEWRRVQCWRHSLLILWLTVEMRHEYVHVVCSMLTSYRFYHNRVIGANFEVSCEIVSININFADSDKASDNSLINYSKKCVTFTICSVFKLQWVILFLAARICGVVNLTSRRHKGQFGGGGGSFRDCGRP